MNNYLGFLFREYYPEGGWKDYVGSSGDVGETKQIIFQQAVRYNYSSFKWHIVDSATMEIVDEGEISIDE